MADVFSSEAINFKALEVATVLAAELVAELAAETFAATAAGALKSGATEAEFTHTLVEVDEDEEDADAKLDEELILMVLGTFTKSPKPLCPAAPVKTPPKPSTPDCVGSGKNIFKPGRYFPTLSNRGIAKATPNMMELALPPM